jgi:MFS family permease
MASGARKSVVLINFTLCSFTFTTVHWMLLSFLPVYMRDQGLTDGQVGAVLGLFSISILAVMLPLGLLSDLFSPRRLVLLGGILFSLYAGCILSAHSYWQFLLIAPFGGLAASAFLIVLYALFLKVMGNGPVGKRIAFYQSGSYLGFGIGPAIAGVLVRGNHFEPLLFCGMAGSVLLVGLILGLPDSSTIRLDLRAYGRDLRQGRTLLFLLFVLVYGTHFGVEQTSFTLLMKEGLGFSSPRIGMVYLAIGGWMAFLAPFAGRRYDARRSVRTFLLAGLAICASFQTLTPFASSLSTMILVRLLHTVGDVLLILSVGLLTTAYFPDARLGGNSAIVYGARTCGMFAGNLGSGYLNGALGYASSFVASGGLLLLFVAVAGTAVGRWLVVGAE